jgi:hypothetical protein
MDHQETARKKNHSPDGLCRIKTAPTEDTTADNIEISRRFTPVQNSDEHISTLSNQRIEISYEMLGLIPTKMQPMPDVLDQILADGVWDIDIKKKKTDEEVVVFRLIVFIYGKGYYSELDPGHRISRIQQCITKVGGNQKRLCEIALSSGTSLNKLLEGFDAYFHMASTARMFFGQVNTTGGFPVSVYHRMQGSQNCYIVAACMFLTVCLQQVEPDQMPLDVGCVGRRHVIDTLEGLEKRVIHDKGDNAMDLVQSIIKSPELLSLTPVELNFAKFPRYQASKQQILTAFLQDGAFGLVSYFNIAENFRVASRKNNAVQQCGYWKFDGNTIDCEGEYVVLDDDDQMGADRVRLEQEWNEQRSKMQTTKNDCDAAMTKVIEHSPRYDLDQNIWFNDDAKGISSAPTGSDQSRGPSTHAMVMIGSCSEFNDGEAKQYYMLWNWWQKMPLILVSFDYLVACQCTVYFMNNEISPEDLMDDVKRNDMLACECDFPDHGEDSWYRQRFFGVDGRDDDDGG